MDVDRAGSGWHTNESLILAPVSAFTNGFWTSENDLAVLKFFYDVIRISNEGVFLLKKIS